MSFFSSLFGAPKSGGGGSGGGGGGSQGQIGARTQIQEAMDVQRKKIDHFNTQILDLKKKAKGEMQKKPQNKALAMQFLKQAKTKEAAVLKLEGYSDNLNSQLQALEMVEFSKQQVSAIKSAQHVMSNQIDLDDALDVVDDAVDQMEKAHELSDALARPMGGAQTIDEEALEADLEALVNDSEEIISVEEIGAGLTTISTGPVLGTDLPSVSNVAPLPAVPKATPQATSTEAEEAELAAWLQ